MSNFETQFAKAKNIDTLSGSICIFIGYLGPVIGILIAVYGISQGMYAGALGFIGIGIVLLISGAPLIALGSNTNQLRKQTAFLALQTWQQQRNINAELGDLELPG
tara:strand:- start:772 stop:1089 length:318 start_codon:yes stop_codon:yes gene_type:complete